MPFLSKLTGGLLHFTARVAPVFFGTLLITATISACQPEGATRVPLAVAFSLSGGEEVLVQNHDLRIKFKSVEEDSRCPIQVRCVRAGEAVLKLRIQHGNEPSEEISLNTNPTTGRDTVTYLNYVVQLRGLNPLPPDANQELKLKDYQARLIIFRQ